MIYNLNNYSNLNGLNNSKQIFGLIVNDIPFVNNSGHFLNILDSIDSEIYDVYIIKDTDFDNFKNDLLDDKVFFDMILIQDGHYELDFLEILIEKCSLFNIKLIFDTSFGVDDFHQGNSFNFLIKNSNSILVNNDSLKKILLEFNNNIFTSNNLLSDFLEDFYYNKMDNDIVIGCIYDEYYKSSLNNVITAVNNIKKKVNNKKITFELVSFEDTNFNVDSLICPKDCGETYSDYISWIKRNLNWDIIVFPYDCGHVNLNDLEFKYLESNLLGIPGVYCNLPSYNNIIIDGENGLISDNNSIESLENIFIRLIDNSNLSETIVHNSYDDIKSNFSSNNFSDFFKLNHRDKSSLLYDEIVRFFDDSNICGFVNFINNDKEIILSKTNIFDKQYYLDNYSDVNYADITPENHYLNLGFFESCKPSLGHDFDILIKFNEFIDNWDMHPLIHYLLYGFRPDFFKIFSNDIDYNVNIINASGKFDSDYYLNDNSDVKNVGINPVIHYVKYGYKELTRNPNNRFLSSFYKHKYLHNSNLFNPFTHYLMCGCFNNFKVNPLDFSNNHFSNNQIDSIFDSKDIKVSIVIPIFEYNENIIKNINNIIDNTSSCADIYLFIFNNLSSKFNNFDENVFIINCKDSINFFNVFKSNISSWNNNDVVILNICTNVSNGWLDNLKIKAYSNDDIDMVSPISNLLLNISPDDTNIVQSIPNLSIEGLQCLLRKSYDNNIISTSVADGFCVYLKNRVLDKFSFDEGLFFGNDENISFFNIPPNVNHIIDEYTYVYHDVSRLSAFDELLFLNNNKFSNQRKINNLFDSDDIQDLKLTYGDVFNNYNNIYLSNRVLYILDESTFKLTYDFLLYDLKEVYDFYFLTYSNYHIRLFNNSDLIYEWYVGNLDNLDLYNLTLRKIYFNILYLLDIKLVHIDDFTFSSLDMLEVSKFLNISVIINYTNNSLIDAKYIDYLKSFDNCVFITDDLNINKNYNESNFNVSLLNKPVLNDKLTRISSNKFSPIKIFIPGNINYKYPFFDKIIELNDWGLFEIHFLGDVHEDLLDIGFNHGILDKNMFDNILDEICPDFLFICDVFPEIFHFINESNIRHIPIFVLNNEILNEFSNELHLVNILNNDFVEKIHNLFNQFNNQYYEYVKEEFLSDDKIILELLEYNQKLSFLYYKNIDYVQKISEVNIFSKDYVKGSYSDFDKFLANSYVQPEIRYPFIEDDKACFAIMDNISDYLTHRSLNNSQFPLVSIIMPVFNRRGIVENAINSVFNQSYKNIELIIIDDGSTDGTIDYLKSLNNDNIKLIFNKHNMGPSGARNEGLKVASGDYIAYLDSDNEWDSNYISSIVGAFLELSDADALYSGQLLYEKSDSYPSVVRFGSMNKSLLNNRNYIDVNCFCHKKEVYTKLGGFNENLKRAEDWDFILKVANNSKMYSIPILLSKYYFDKVDNRISDYAFKNHEQVLEHKFFTMLIKNNNKITKTYDYKLIKPISIIIPSFESLMDIQECIESILALYNDNVEIIVVDNNSSKAVRYYLNCLVNENKIKLIQNNINYGFTYAVNQGIELSNPDADILLMNNDAILTEYCLEVMQNYAYSLDNCGIVVPQQVLPGNTPTIKTHVPYASPIFECDVNPSAHHKNIINMPIFHDGEVLELNFAPFFCTYIKRNTLNSSMGLDAMRGRHYRSDVIFSEYVRHVLGLKIYHVSNAIVYHKLQQSTHKLKENKEEYDVMFSKNRWDDDLAKKLKFKRPLWDY